MLKIVSHRIYSPWVLSNKAKIMEQSFSSPVSHIRHQLEKMGYEAVLIRSTDRYFNEYIPKSESPRALISGFDGSVGDSIITKDQAHLFVDGRYTLQAKKQAPDFQVHVCAHNQSIEQNWLDVLAKLCAKGQTLVYDPSTLDLKLFARLDQKAQNLGIQLNAQGHELIYRALPDLKAPTWKLTKIRKDITGLSLEEKLSLLNEELTKAHCAGFLFTKLDDIGWLLNARSNRFPFQTSIPGIAAIIGNKILLGLSEGYQADFPFPDFVKVVQETEFFSCLSSEWHAKEPLGIDENETSKAHEHGLQELQISVKSLPNPVAFKKALKNEKELTHMHQAFYTADQVVYQTHRYVVECFEKEHALSEAQVDDYVKKSFFASGATELSFRPICASGKNGAVIHYGTPDSTSHIERGSLFLLDTGAYYEGGYATDLTRTFLAAPKKEHAKDWQKEMFTLVLLASIRGLSARIRKGTIGMQLDAIVRAPLWQRGLDFGHGTGHGIGINVHEFPPRIGPSSTTPLLANQVFSIEPGLYFEGLGGVRIENLVTLVADKDDDRFLRVLPLTFSPFDERLIEEKLLSESDKAFLQYFKAQWQKGGKWPELPPLNGVKWVP